MVKLSSIRDKLGLLFTSNFTTQEEGERSKIEGKVERGGGKHVVLKLSFYSLLSPENWWISYEFCASLQPRHAIGWEGSEKLLNHGWRHFSNNEDMGGCTKAPEIIN